MMARTIKLFANTVVVTQRGLKRARDVSALDYFVDNFGSLHRVDDIGPVGEDYAARLTVNGHWTSENLPATAEIKAAKSGTALLGPYRIDEIAKTPGEYSVLLPKRRLAINRNGSMVTALDFENPESLFKVNGVKFLQEFLTRLSMPEEGDKIKHSVNALYLACDDIVQARWMALLASAHGVRVQIHPNTPIVYVDHKRPSCFITKLSSGVFAGADAADVIDEFYGSDLFVPPIEITRDFIARTLDFGVVCEGLPIENFYHISQIQLSTKQYPTREFSIASAAHIDTAFIQI